jgi:hypothetical protein
MRLHTAQFDDVCSRAKKIALSHQKVWGAGCATWQDRGSRIAQFIESPPSKSGRYYLGRQPDAGSIPQMGIELVADLRLSAGDIIRA